MDIKIVKTEPYADQHPGTSGLRKRVSVARQEHYIENFVQSIFDCLEAFEGKTLIVGGDGRYLNAQALQTIFKIAAANQVGRIVVGQNGLLSTPAASHLIRKHKAFGGIILSASHNPGGPEGDFGIKFNTEAGAPAPAARTEAFFHRSRVIDHFWTLDAPDVDLSRPGEQALGSLVIEVVDAVKDYADYMQEIFDFAPIRRLFEKGFQFIFDAMNAVTGPYAKYIFEELLGAPHGSVIHGTPLPDFGGLRPDPNLVHAKHLVDMMFQDQTPDLAAASDGDGDRFMILGRQFFVTPSDSLALFADYLDTLPFYQGKVYGVARSFPTSPALDFVARRRNLPCWQTPTGWKFFASLLEHRKIALCGEESFGAGSFHLQEKDGIWAVLLWLSILARTGKSAQELIEELWRKDGRVYYTVHNHEELETAAATVMMGEMSANCAAWKGQTLGGYRVKEAFNFAYTDPVSGETTTNHGICVMLEPDAQIVMRLSATDGIGSTLRIYISRHMKDAENYHLNTQEALGELAALAVRLADLKTHAGRDTPTTIT